MAAGSVAFEKREKQERIRDLRTALSELNPSESPDEYRLLRLELEKLNRQRPDTKRLPAS